MGRAGRLGRGGGPGHRPCTVLPKGAAWLPTQALGPAAGTTSHYSLQRPPPQGSTRCRDPLPKALWLFTLLCSTGGGFCLFYKLKARPSSRKKIAAGTTVLLAFRRWAESKRGLSQAPVLRRKRLHHCQAHTEMQLWEAGATQRIYPLPSNICILNCQGQLSFQRKKIKVLSSFNLILLLHQWS